MTKDTLHAAISRIFQLKNTAAENSRDVAGRLGSGWDNFHDGEVRAYRRVLRLLGVRMRRPTKKAKKK